MHGAVPVLHPFWAAGISFSRGHFVARVPYDCCLPMLFQASVATRDTRHATRDTRHATRDTRHATRDTRV